MTVPALCQSERKWQLKLVISGAVKASQRTAGSCSSADFYYSVLESPWLEFTTESCLQFRYRRYTPAALDVFLALHNGSVLTVLDRNSNGGSGVLSTYTWTVPPGVGKVLSLSSFFDSVMDSVI